MLKLLRVLPSTSRNWVLEMEVLSSSRNPQVRDFSTAARETYVAKGYTTDRVFAPYYVYKGKAAMSLSPVLPTFTKLDSGALVVERRGSIMMVFTPAIGERKYDWEKRQKFALSATEVGSLIAMGPQDSCEFFHDPSMSSSNAGQVRKSLSIKPHANSSGYFVSLTVVNNLLNAKENFNVPVTTAEFAVMKTACSFALPHIMGWDRLTNQQSSLPGGTVGLQSKVDKPVFDLEWDK
ncbi:single-stranded DNA-binding protein WHY2, mitochondrial [Lotus japonicus]|uniref:WHY domain class transcription factor n=1 Tax=Lotus japonicus TaxID=34305 RepID=I3SAE2_LOTJA|nr:single-stranded DNA-binding protein WHY2, mitochondrial [Lotus japonicus]AFK37234.1 unknown [Lotus japonicus]